MIELVRIFQNETRASVSIDFDFNPSVARRIADGESFDVAVTNPHLIDQLEADGLIDRSTRIKFGQIPLALAAHRDHPPIDIFAISAFRQALLGAKTIGYAPEGTSGKRVMLILDRLGLTEAVAPKLRPMAGGYAGQAVALGEVEYSIAPISTLLTAAPDAMVVGTLPADFDTDIEFCAALGPAAPSKELGAVFIRFIVSARFDQMIALKGVLRR